MYAISYTCAWTVFGVVFSFFLSCYTFNFSLFTWFILFTVRIVSHLIQINHFIFVWFCGASLDFSSMRRHFCFSFFSNWKAGFQYWHLYINWWKNVKCVENWRNFFFMFFLFFFGVLVSLHKTLYQCFIQTSILPNEHIYLN